jgi:aspartate/glutamate racemase
MGCTEIPLVLKQEDIGTALIDPKKIIARKAVSLALA